MCISTEGRQAVTRGPARMPKSLTADEGASLRVPLAELVDACHQETDEEPEDIEANLRKLGLVDADDTVSPIEAIGKFIANGEM